MYSNKINKIASSASSRQGEMRAMTRKSVQGEELPWPLAPPATPVVLENKKSEGQGQCTSYVERGRVMKGASGDSVCLAMARYTRL